VNLADQLTLARAAAVPLVVVLFVWDFPNHNWWATGVFIVAMTTLIVLVDEGGAWDESVATGRFGSP
jgi:hypothetical protein